jgi:NMD protein affecting ribosome stability and mRNA decay
MNINERVKSMEWMDYEIIECSECGEEKQVEKGTWALEKGMCEQCYCIYQGG